VPLINELHSNPALILSAPPKELSPFAI